MNRNPRAGWVITILMGTSFAGWADVQRDFVEYGLSFERSNVTMVPIRGSSEAQDFWISSTEITWEQYRQWFMGRPQGSGQAGAAAPSRLAPGAIGWHRLPGFADKPVFGITPYAAASFCQWLSAKFDGFYRLPTQREWDYVYSAGETAMRADGIPRASQWDWDEIGYFLWSDAIVKELRHSSAIGFPVAPVRSKRPNKLGVYDLEGNVAEWTMSEIPVEGGEGVEMNAKDRSRLPWNPRRWVVKGNSAFSDFVSFHPAKTSLPLDKNINELLVSEEFGWLTTPDKDALLNGIRLVRPRHPPPESEWVKYWKCEKTEKYDALFLLKSMERAYRARGADRFEDWFLPRPTGVDPKIRPPAG